MSQELCVSHHSLIAQVKLGVFSAQLPSRANKAESAVLRLTGGNKTPVY